MFAAKGGSAEVCQLLLDARADVHAANPIGWTALFWAALHGQMSAMEVLRAAGAIISDKLLILVCYTGNAGALEALIASTASAQQARCLCTDESRQNLLHLAVSGLAYEKNAAEAHFRCVQLLLEVHCDVSATEVRGRTVLQHYIMDNHWQSEGLEHKAIHLQAVRCLCVARADPLSEGLLGRSAVAIADGSKLRLLQQELARCRHAGTMVTVERTLPLWMRLASCICGTSWWQR
ncbi:unnamed protein product [Polarella glacialis]|nr:unnamed protein product [Polarella glacialis]